MKILLTVATILIAGSAIAGPCETAKRGTYLSNVCWLFRDFPDSRNPRIVSTDEKTCDVVMEEWFFKRVATRADPHPDSPYDWKNERRTRRFTLSLSRVNLTESDVEYNKLTHTVCLRLRGKDVNSYPDVLTGRDTYVVCGRKASDRVVAAVKNLYSRYCESRKSEF